MYVEDFYFKDINKETRENFAWFLLHYATFFAYFNMQFFPVTFLCWCQNLRTSYLKIIKFQFTSCINYFSSWHLFTVTLIRWIIETYAIYDITLQIYFHIIFKFFVLKLLLTFLLMFLYNHAFTVFYVKFSQSLLFEQHFAEPTSNKWRISVAPALQLRRLYLENPLTHKILLNCFKK